MADRSLAGYTRSLEEGVKKAEFYLDEITRTHPHNAEAAAHLKQLLADCHTALAQLSMPDHTTFDALPVEAHFWTAEGGLMLKVNDTHASPDGYPEDLREFAADAVCYSDDPTSVG